LVAVLDLQVGAVRQVVLLLLAAGVVDDLQEAVAVHHHHRAVLLLHDLGVLELDLALEAVLEAGLLDLAARGRATDVERAHRELRARLADGLGRDHADRLAHVHLVAAREVTPVAERADAAPVLTGQHRADDHLLDARLFDLDHAGLVDLLAGLDDDGLVVTRVEDVLERGAAEDALAEALDDLAALLELRHLDAVERAAVVGRDDRVLRHVDETPREVAGVRRLEGGVRET